VTFLQTYLINAAVILGIMTVMWIVSLILKNASIVDIFWGTGFAISAWVYHLLTPTPSGDLALRKWLLGILVTIWGLRLSFYILWRNWGKPEDFRYRKWREENGKRWWWFSFFQVFLLQGFLMWVISAPLLAAQIGATPPRLGLFDVLALFLWLIGFFFEAVGDLQLARFKADPANKGRVLDRGVWRYTRHPNYFGDAAQWWAYYLLSLAAGGWWAIFGPIIMNLLLLRVSGVALLEKTLKETKPQYRAYIESTSAFIPWFPKKKRPK
jgi:steroid 5-alpha reductase family enzyme